MTVLPGRTSPSRPSAGGMLSASAVTRRTDPAAQLPPATPPSSAEPQGPPADSGAADGGVQPTDSIDGEALAARIAALVARATTPMDEALERQREEFDYVTRIQAEADREINALRDLAMEQIKHEDELLKKWIALV